MPSDSPRIDLERLKVFEGEDFETGEPLLKSILVLYLEHAPKFLSLIQSHLQSPNFSELHRAAHNLSSSSASVGARGLAEMCSQLEFHSNPKKASPLSVLETLTHKIATELPRVQIELRSILAKIKI